MNEKKNFRLKDEKFNVFIPLVNLLLFDKLESPDFDSENEKLSENFTKFFKLKEQVDLEENEFFKTRIINYLSLLKFEERSSIFQIICENEVYIQSVLMFAVLDGSSIIKNKTIELTQERLLIEFTRFKFHRELNKIIFYYFIFHFESIFGYNFSDKNNIIRSEYFDIVENLCRAKKFID